MIPDSGLVLRYYVAEDGRSRFEQWFSDLDAQAAAKVSVALVRLGQSNLSNVKSVGAGLFEHQIHWGPGYRIYFGRDGDALSSSSAGERSNANSATLLWPRSCGRTTGGGSPPDRDGDCDGAYPSV